MTTKTIPCPLCGGEIHAIAGRCKHCKADLVDLRERAARVARAQAMGATVPPTRPVAFTVPPHRPRGVTQPPSPGPATGPMAAMPSGGFEAQADAGDPSNQAPTLVDAPGDAPAPAYQPPPEYSPGPAPYGRPQHAPPNGTGQYALGFAGARPHGARPHRVSTWSRRWPFVVSAVALLAIGISIGVLAERWRRDGEARKEAKPRQSQASRQPGLVPDHMPQPLMPAPRTPRVVPDPSAPSSPSGPSAPSSPSAPDRDADADRQPPGSAPGSAPPESAPPDPPDPPDPPPDPSNPGSRFSQPPSSDRGGDARAFRTFTTALTDSLCQKLTQCGFIDSATQSMCEGLAREMDSEVAGKVERGECSFNRRAADACLQAVADLSCDMGSSDRMWDWLRQPRGVGECAEAYVCDEN